MASDVDIANLALLYLGQTRIGGFSDNTKQARDVSFIYESQRDAELRAHVWKFAVKRIQLSASTAVPPFGFNFYYPKPTDCLRVLMVGDFFPGLSFTDYRNAPDVDYAIEGDQIATDLPAPLSLRYIAQITDPTQFDTSFVDALACRLAMKLCEDLTQSNTKQQSAMQGYKQALMDAIRVNAVESPPEPLADGAWIMERL